jgi:hypothetical protein
MRGRRLYNRVFCQRGDPADGQANVRFHPLRKLEFAITINEVACRSHG